MINVSVLAVTKLKEILEEEGKPESSLRIMVSPNPNGGPSYSLTLEDQAREVDTVLDANGVCIVVDSDSLPLVEGAEIDYVEGLMRSGFVINNPNFASEGGGCGSEGGGCACGGNCACGGH
jgi:iron-sulfur cluster insertion protein